MELGKKGENCVISEYAHIGRDVTIGHNCIIEQGVRIGDNSFIDSNTIIKCESSIGNESYIGSNCIIGETGMPFAGVGEAVKQQLLIGEKAVIRSGTILYADSEIGTEFQTGHHVTIREKTRIGDHVSVGTLSDIQGDCRIGDYVRIHSNVHIGKQSVIDSFVWIFPYVVLTNDPTPPSDNMEGVHIHTFATVATAATILPGVEIHPDSLVAAGATVTKDVESNTIVGGTPARVIGDIRSIVDQASGKRMYPWRYHFDKYMPWENIGYENWYLSLGDTERAIVASGNDSIVSVV